MIPHVVGLLLPLFGATTKTEDQVKSRLLLDVTGGGGLTRSELCQVRRRLTNQKECDRPPAVFQRRSIAAGRGEF